MELDEYHKRTAQEAVGLAEGDPMVKAGWLSVELIQFRIARGSIRTPGNPLNDD